MVKSRVQFNIADLLYLYMVVYFTCKFADFIPIFRILITGICAFFIVCFKANDIIFSKNILNRASVYLILYIFITFTIYIFKIENDRYWNIVDNSIKILILCVLCAYFETTSSDFQKSVLRLSLFGYFLTMLSTLFNAIIDPTILRATASREVTSKIILGLGGYDFIYGLVIVNILFTVYLAKRVISQNRFFYVLFIILNTLTIILSGYTTATILNIIFILIALISCSKINVLFSMIILIFLFVSPWLLPNAILAFSKFGFVPEIISERLNEIALFLSGSKESLTYFEESGERGERLSYSLQMFFKHPIMGNFLTEKDCVFGEHTEWIDRLAQFGILIVMLILAFWCCKYKAAKKKLKNNSITTLAVNISYFYFIVLGFLNPISYALTVFPLLFLVPYLHILFLKDDENTELEDNSMEAPS